MIKPAGFTVTESAMRRASTARECFYCQQPIGSVHADDCVLVLRRVRLRVTIEYEVDVPAGWDKGQIEFHRNESSWCADNALEEIKEFLRAKCLCSYASFAFLRDVGKPFLQEKG